MEDTQEQTRPFAVITGASYGVGFELAKKFAENGYDLLIASDSEAILEAQDDLEVFGTDVECIEVNLGTYKGVQILTETIMSYNRPVDVLVINAGEGTNGSFLDTNLRDEINLINLNIISAVHLTKNLIGDMFNQGAGKILFTTSFDSASASPFDAVYNSSKAFITTFAESIRYEAKDHGVSVTTMIPEGEFELVEVARQGYEAVIAGVENVFDSSLKSKFQGWASKVLPERFKASYHRKTSETHA